MKRKGFPSASRDVRTCLHIISNFISLWFTPPATAHPLPLAFEVLGLIYFYFFPLTPGTAKLALPGTHPREGGERSTKAPSLPGCARAAGSAQLHSWLLPSHHHPFSTRPSSPGASHTSTHDLLFSTISFHPFTLPLLMTTRSSKPIPVRKKQSFFLDLSLENLSWISVWYFFLIFILFCLKFRGFSQTPDTHANPRIPSISSFYLLAFPRDATNLWTTHQLAQKPPWILWDHLSAFKTVVPARNWKSALCCGSAESAYFKIKTQVIMGKQARILQSTVLSLGSSQEGEREGLLWILVQGLNHTRM